MQLRPFLKLIRFKNLLMVFITLILTKYSFINSFAPQNLSIVQFSILAVSILLITAGGYIINDIFDIETDTINKPNAVFIEKNIAKKSAFQLYIIFTIIGVLLGVFLSFSVDKPIYSFVFIGTAIGLYLYSQTLKKLPLIGNLTVSLLISTSIYIVYLFEVSITFTYLQNSLFIYIIFSFLTTLIREIVKDIEDIDGDYQQKMNTLPILIGRKRAKMVAFILTGFLFVFTIVVSRILVVKSMLFFGYSIVFTVLPLSYLLFRLWEASTKKQFAYISNILKIIMLFGILSMLLFQFI